jgi:hypothetical protein
VRRLTLVASSFVVALSIESLAVAGELTFCVGGEDPRTGHSACNSAKYECRHLLLIHKQSQQCFTCRDKRDNTCVTEFLRNPKWREWASQYEIADEFLCWRRGFAPVSSISVEVVEGQLQSAPPAPPPRMPVALRTEISVPERPRGAGERLGLSARVLAPDGSQRQITRARVSVLGPDGKQRFSGPARVAADGSITSDDFVLPKEAGEYRVRVEISGVTLAATEELRGDVISEKTIRVAACVGALRVETPVPGASFVAGDDVLLHGKAFGADGAALTSGAGRLRWVTSVSGIAPTFVPASNSAGVLSGSFKPSLPPGMTQAEFTLQLVDESGEICASKPLPVVISELGVALEIEPRPARCYVQTPCTIGVAVRVPESGPAAEKARQFLDAPDLRLDAWVGKEAKPGALRRDGPRRLSLSFEPEGAVESSLRVVLSRGDRSVSATRPVLIRPQLELRTTPELDFKSVQAGKSACLPVDLAGSKGAEDQKFRLSATLPSDCGANLYAELVEGRLPLSAGSEPFEATPWADSREGSACDPKLLGYCVCLEPPRCAGAPLQKGELTLTPVDLEDVPQALRAEWVRRQGRRIPVRFSVQGRGFFDCYFVYLCAAAGTVLVLLSAGGVVLPRGFRPSDFVRVASQPGKLPSAPRRRLRDLPGGRTGFYRSACVGLNPDGSHPRSARAPIRFVPAPSGVAVVLRGATLSRVNPRTRQLEKVTKGREGNVLTRASVYEAAGIYFEVA